MKITLLALVIIFSSLVLAGCSLVPSKNSGGVKQFALSQDIWKSIDGGETWQLKNHGEGGANIKNADVLSFAVNPYDSDNVFAGLKKGGILKTENGGDTWKFINFQSEKVYGLALDPTNGKTLYASGVWEGTGKIFRSEDQGENWKEIYTSPSAGPIIISITIDKKSPNIIYATTSGNEALKSSDGGVSWKNIYLDDTPIVKISEDASDNNLIYFVTDGRKVFRSKNGGSDFENITDKVDTDKDNKTPSRLSGRNFDILETDPFRANNVYLAGEGGIVLSQDAGETWKKISVLNNPQNFPIKALAIDPKDSTNLVYGASKAIYKSNDGGVNWITSQFDTKKTANVIVYDLSNPNVVYAGFSQPSNNFNKINGYRNN